MREIKFRAWDGKNIWHNQFNITAYGHIQKSETAREYHSWKNEEWILMQYTGLNDLYDIPIYEGDVLRCIYRNKKEPQIILGKVVWDIEEALFRFESDHEPEMLYECYKYAEIIGNIYENSELIMASS